MLYKGRHNSILKIKKLRESIFHVILNKKEHYVFILISFVDLLYLHTARMAKLLPPFSTQMRTSFLAFADIFLEAFSEHKFFVKFMQENNQKIPNNDSDYAIKIEFIFDTMDKITEQQNLIVQLLFDEDFTKILKIMTKLLNPQISLELRSKFLMGWNGSNFYFDYEFIYDKFDYEMTRINKNPKILIYEISRKLLILCLFHYD